MTMRAPIMRAGAMAALVLALSACVLPPGERPAPGTFSPPQTELNRR